MSTASATPTLTRERVCFVAGVCGGLARHLGWNVTLVRAIFVVLTVFSGAGILLYAWLWAFTGWADGPERVDRRLPVSWLLTGVAILLAVLGAAGLVLGTSAWVGLSAAAAIVAVGAGAWTGFVDRADAGRGPRTEGAVRATLTVTLVALGVIVAWMGSRSSDVAAIVVVLVLLVAIGLIYAPSLVTLWRDLNTERVRRIRDEQRSEMAAHLHDSVLQTLALIQNRAGASSEAGRLARAQERELRSWLYEGDAVADSDLATDLRDFSAALELDYPVRIDVIAVGTSTERASGELAAAAREAMLNAARHAGGEVSVYIEGSPARVDVYVRDRGPGFTLAEVASDRLGVRQSIIGRMRRAGGTATVRPGAGGVGTEVHLQFGAEAARG